MSSLIYVFAAVLSLALVAISWTLIREKRRSQSLMERAALMGFSFRAKAESPLSESFSGIPLFAFAAAGVQSQMSNLMESTRSGRRLVVCDYHYWTGGSHRNDSKQTVVCVTSGSQDLPPFTLHPVGNVLQRRLGAVGLKMMKGMMKVTQPLARWDTNRPVLEQLLSQLEASPVDLNDPDFSGRFELRGADSERLAKIIDSRVRELLTNQPAPFPSVECSGKWLAFYRKNRLVAPSELQTLLEEAFFVLQTISNRST